MFTHRYKKMDPHQHSTAQQARDCEAAHEAEEPRDVYWDGVFITRSEEQRYRLEEARAARTHNGAIRAMFRSHSD